MQYRLEEDKVGIFLNEKLNYILSVIIYDKQKYKLNGIDIYEKLLM